MNITAGGMEARWAIAHAAPPGVPQPAGCNEGVRTKTPIIPGLNGSAASSSSSAAAAAGLSTVLLAGRALKDAPFWASVGFCTGAPSFSTIGHYKLLPANESWMYLSTGKLVGGNLSVDVTPWGQPVPSGPSVEVPRANVSASLTRKASGGADVASYSADFFLNGELVGSLSVQLPAGAGDAAAAALYGCAVSCANATVLGMAEC